MAISEESSEITRPRIGSHETALCVVPPPHLCQDIDRLRANYDKTYGKWPAHINLIYPFVAIETLPEAIDLIRSKLVSFGPESRHQNIRLCLDKPNYFPHRRRNTVYITDSNENEAESFTELRSAILECFKNTEDSYQPHLTIGQSEGLDADSLEYLLAKASLLSPVQWQVEELVVLFRERLSGQDDMSSQMKVWATINLSYGTVTEAKRSRNLTRKSQKDDWSDEEETCAVNGNRRCGATFDPGENALAAESVGKGLNNRPQRYDRILVKGENLLGVTGFNMFGFTEDSSGETSYGEMLVENAVPNYGSDHWGIRASFRTDIDPVAGQSAKIEDCRSALLQIRKAPLGLSDITAFKSCLAEFRMVPTDEELSKRKEVFELLRSVLQKSSSHDNSRSSFSIVVVHTGSYSLGVWTTASDVDCLCIGSIRAKTFFALAGHRLRKAVDLGIKILRKVKANSGTILELEIRGVKLDLQYCPATRIAESWPEVMELPPSDQLFDLPIQSLSKLNSFRDPDYLQRTIPDLFAFRLAHRFIRAWAKQRGIFSSKFGYLGGIHITLLLSRICKLLFREAGAMTAADLACTFFNYYANFDWKTQMVLDPFFHKQQPRYRRSAREPMVILGLHSPRANVAHTASLPSVRTLVEELNRADNLLSEENMTWSKVVDGVGMEGAPANQPNGVHEYLKSYNSYIKIDVHYWGLSLAKGSMLLGWLESRCVLLLVDINKKFPDIHARIWPARFTPNHTNDDDERDYQGCYLIGLAKGENAEALAKAESDRKLAQGTLQTALEKYGDQIRGNENYFDAISSWVSVTHVKQSDLGDLRLDDREWGDYVVREDDKSDTEDDEEEEEDTAVDLDDSNDATMVPPSTNKVKTPSTSKPVSSKKLRPATDILNRLRWDPSLDSSDHIVGYEDRFLGTREIGLDRWKTEQTDDEFIPQHRTVYFRRKSDGVVVWHRERRLDGVFGSGAGRGEEE